MKKTVTSRISLLSCVLFVVMFLSGVRPGSAQLVVYPSSLYFPSVTVGTSSYLGLFLVYADSLHSHSVTISHTNTSDFSISSLTGSHAFRGSLSGSVTFTPHSIGYAIDTIDIVDSAGSHHFVGVLGLGVAPPLLSITRLTQQDSVTAGDTLCTIYAVVNISSDTAILQSAHVFSNLIGSGFSISAGTPLPATLLPGDTAYVALCFTNVLPNYYSGGFEAVYSDTKGATDSLSAMIGLENLSGGCLSLDGFISRLDFAPVSHGDSISQEFSVYNASRLPITINATYFSGSSPESFSFDSPSLPVTIAAGTHQTMRISFHAPEAPTPNSYVVKLAMELSSPCNEFEIPVYANIFDVAVDTAYVDMFPDSSVTLSVQGDTIYTVHAILFHNNNSSTVIVRSSGFVGSDTSYFIKLEGDGGYSDTILAGGYYFFKYMIRPIGSGTYDASIQLVIDHALTTQLYALHVTPKHPLSGVTRTSAPLEATISIAPNPMRDDVTINASSISRARIEIFDVLGNSIAVHNGTSNWNWNAETNGGSRVADGSYFVRVSGMDDTGHQVVKTERLVIGR